MRVAHTLSNTRRAVRSHRNSPRAGDAAVGARVAQTPDRRRSRSIAAASSSGSSAETTSAGAAATSGSAPRSVATTGTPSGHRFEHRDAESFLERRLHEADRAFVQRAPARGIDVADVPARSRSSGGRGIRSSHGRAAVGRLAGEHEPGQIAARRARQPLVRVEQSADVLARLERAEEQHVAVAGGRSRAASRAARRASRPTCDPRARRSVAATSPAVKCETAMIASARRACAARQRRVVAADLGARALGMREEVEIVDRDDLRGVARRHQQRDAASARRRTRRRPAIPPAASRAGATPG